MSVLDFCHVAGGSSVMWTSHGLSVEKIYGGPISAVALSDGSGVLVIEPFVDQPDNAVILNEDGSERVRVDNPLGDRGAICFTEAGYEGEALILISRLRGLEMACVIDEEGNNLRQYEIR